MAAIESMDTDAYFNEIHIIIKELGFVEVVTEPSPLPMVDSILHVKLMEGTIVFVQIMRPENALPNIRIDIGKKYTHPLSMRQQSIIRYFQKAETVLAGQIVCDYTKESEAYFDENEPCLSFYHYIDLYDYPQTYPSQVAFQAILTGIMKRFKKLLDTVDKVENQKMEPTMEQLAVEYASILGGNKPL